MILSMTGYGKSDSKSADYDINVEIKSINNRFFDPIFKLNPLLRSYEREILSLIKTECIRGRIYVNINIDNTSSSNEFILNTNRLNSYVKILNEIKNEANIKEPISIQNLLNYQDIINNNDSLKNDKSKRLIFKTIKSALKDFKNFRKKEGNNILNDINYLLKKIETHYKKIEIISQGNINKELSKYKKKIKKYMPNFSKLDDQRLYQEIAIIIEKKDINEELIRFRSHMKLFYQYLKSMKNEGKKKNFLLQEMNREINTVGSKSDNVKIRHLVVSIKDNLEKLREQIQNIL